MSDPTPTDEELREADALAEALDAKDPSSGAPADALQAAQLLRFSKDNSALTPEQLARGKAALELDLAKRRRRFRWRRGGPIQAALLILAIITVAVHLARSPSPPAPVVTEAVDREVLLAQARAVAAHDPAQLDAAMRSYRGPWLAKLEKHYGGAP